MDNSIKSNAFTLSEAIITLVIIGIIAVICIPQLIFGDTSKKGQMALAKKMNGYLAQASIEILLHNAVLDDFLDLKDEKGRFSIEGSDTADITKRMSNLYLKYLSDVDISVKQNEYFENSLLNYDKTPLGSSLKDLYSDFFYVNDGMIIGFRFYGTCSATETNTVLPELRNRQSVENVCGSVFYDINAFSKPNKLGTDQFIIPVGKRGIVYESETQS